MKGKEANDDVSSGEKYDDKLDALIEGVFTRAEPEHQKSEQTRAVVRASSLMSQLPDDSQRSDGQYVSQKPRKRTARMRKARHTNPSADVSQIELANNIKTYKRRSSMAPQPDTLVDIDYEDEDMR